MDRLKAAECFGDFLKPGLGIPEQLEGYQQVRYSLHVAPNAKLIIESNAKQDTIMICTEYVSFVGICIGEGGCEEQNNLRIKITAAGY